jgi:hypothetical protein
LDAESKTVDEQKAKVL